MTKFLIDDKGRPLGDFPDDAAVPSDAPQGARFVLTMTKSLVDAAGAYIGSFNQAAGFPEAAPEGAQFVDGAPERAGDRWDGAGWAPDLAQLKAVKRAAAVALFAAKQEAGAPYGGKVVQLREEDLTRINGAALKATLALNPASGVAWAPDFAWRMADNSMLPLATPVAMIGLAAAAAAAYEDLRKRLWAIKDAIEAADTAEKVAAIDETKGWPGS
ncbi:hypothetical protein [Hypericibacter sp.]|uniref:DUF4376 domain-containing protein n=1 Tax=Hypericibacter sp. TaxID=2705401 RepID=UPI003D6CD3FF